jgi:hypothetical protein
MQLQEIPFGTIADWMQDRAARSSGWNGAALGAGMGVARALALVEQRGLRTGLRTLALAGGLGALYGAADPRLTSSVSPG